MDQGTRVMGRTMTISSTTGRQVFGPFLSGERVLAIRLMQSENPAATPTINYSFRAFTERPADTAASFGAGRPLHHGATVAIPSPATTGAIQLEVPVQWECDGTERYVGFEVTEASASNLTITGWPILERPRADH